MSNGPDWFAPKRFGYGAGLPIAWQGWVLLLAYIGLAMAGAALLAPAKPLLFLSLFLPLTAIFVLVVARTTRGGWRWRWGDKE
jgi:hypothetical protein